MATRIQELEADLNVIYDQKQARRNSISGTGVDRSTDRCVEDLDFTLGIRTPRPYEN